MITKTRVVGLAIGTGVLASLVVGGVGFQGQTFDTPETAAAILQTLPFDESQESGGSYPVSKVTLPQQLVFDADQEGGAPILR